MFAHQDDIDRLVRLVRAEKEMNIEDEAVGGQQSNSILELRKEEKQRQTAANVQAAMAQDNGQKDDGTRDSQVTIADIGDTCLLLTAKLVKNQIKWMEKSLVTI